MAIVSFYNAAYLPARIRFFETGEMETLIPDQDPWYLTPHIHPVTVKEFENLCHSLDIRIVERTFVDEEFAPLKGVQAEDPHTWAFAAVYLLEKAS